MKFFKFKKIRDKIVVYMVLPLFIALVISTLTGLYFVEYSTNLALEKLSEESAVLASDMVYDMMTNLIQKSEVISHDDVITRPTASAEAVSKSLKNYQDSIGFIGFKKLDLKTGYLSDGMEVTEEVVQSVSDGKAYISSPYYKPNGTFIFDIYIPLYDAFNVQTYGLNYKQKVIAGFALEFDPMVITNTLKETILGTNGISYIIDKNGNTIGSTEDYSQVTGLENTYQDYLDTGENMGLALKEKDMVEGNEGFYEYEYAGDTWISGYSPIEEFGWSLSVEINRSEFATVIPIAATVCTILTVILVVISCALAVGIAKSMSVPIVKVEEQLNNLSNGYLPEPMTSNTGNEIDMMVASLNKTTVAFGAMMKDIGYTLGEMAKGNFEVTSRAREYYVNDFKAILDALANIKKTMASTLGGIKEAGNQVKMGASQVSDASQALSQGSVEQAASVEELSSTINELYIAVKENTANAQVANEAGLKATNSVMESNVQMTNLMNAMEDINDKSNEISKIIKTIEDIAFQTNILALNAAVEAARAGAAGKGFAVVADEVRNLASKSDEAAKSVTNLIAETTQAIKNGSDISSQTSLAMQAVVEETQKTVELVNKISKASIDQENAVSQITVGIDQINSVVQTNSATAQECAASSEELNGQATLLDNLLSRFRI